MKITKQGDKFLIEVDDKELEMLSDGMDLKQQEELDRNGNAFVRVHSKEYRMVSNMAIDLHEAFMGRI
jgi:hypothetical protein